MPDWSYQTVFRPILFRMPFEPARNLALGSMGRLSRFPGGRFIIELMGHMRPDARLSRTIAGLHLDSPVGLGAGIDTGNVAIPALAKFGFGLLEVGPLDLRTDQPPHGIDFDAEAEMLRLRGSAGDCSAETIRDALRVAAVGQSVLLRLVVPEEVNEAARTKLIAATKTLQPHVAGVTLQIQARNNAGHGVSDEATGRWLMELRQSGFTQPVFLVCDQGQARRIANDWTEADSADRPAGVLIHEPLESPNDGVRFGAQCFDATLSGVTGARAANDTIPILAAGGVHEPQQAHQILAAGADVVLIDTGLVFAGPGLPKRINEVVLHDLGRSDIDRKSSNFTNSLNASADDGARVKPSWFWTLLLAVSMFVGGVLAMIIASTRVVLPYDEEFIGMTREELCGINDRLLPFLTHDRVTLAGTMLADGILYLALSLWGIRAGFHWARITILASAMVGFFSFFLFLGFGYFDPFHAFTTAVLFQFTLLAMNSHERMQPQIAVPDLRNDRAWRMGLWGQLIYVIHGAAILTGGCVICTFGVSTVFVQSDLDFMQTTAEILSSASPRLIPMIAHDRAGFGGMLISCGICVLLSSLWGFRRGAAWLWWAILIAGLAAYGSTITVHLAVGYTSLKHMLPAYGGLLALVLGSGLSAQWMLERKPQPMGMNNPD